MIDLYSASKGLEEREYEFKLDLYAEVVPEVY
jgi:hypothetical protein